MDVLDLDAVGQAEALRRREVSAAELAQAAQARIAEEDGALHAVVAMTGDVAAEQAAVADAAAGPLAGVPIVLKDLAVRQRGVPVGLGVRRLEARDLRSRDDSVTGARLRAAGCVTVAVTSTSPFGFGPWAGTATGSTRTPYDPSRASSGSGGGSAALVAAGAVAVGTGADAGGSIRLPAAWCGLVGHKPSRGLVPTDLVEPLVTEGVVTRTVRDTAAALDVLAGAVPGDVFAAGPPVGSFAATLQGDLPPLRVGVLDPPADGTDPAVRRALEATARALEDLGHGVEASQPPALLESPPSGPVADATLALLAHAIEEAEALAGEPFASGDLPPYLEALAERGRRVSGADRLRRDAWLQGWSRRVLAWWRDHDVLLTPTCPLLPQPAELWEPAHDDPSAAFARWGPAMAYVAPCNRSGQPAISLPVAVEGGLPVGVQLVGAPGSDALLLRLAAALEAVFGWDRRPLPPRRSR